MANPWDNDPIVGAPQSSAAAPWASDPVVGAPPPASGPSSLDPDYYDRIAKLESNGNPLAVNKSTGASGLYQWMPATAKQYGITDPFNKDQNEKGIRRFTGDNLGQLSSSLGRAPTSAEAYLAHVEGAGGAAKLLSNPDAKAVDIVGKDAVVLNGGSEDMTAADFAKVITDKYTNSNPNSMAGSAAGVLNRIPTGGQPQRGYDALMHRQTDTGGLPEAAKSFMVAMAHGGIDVPLNSAASGATWIGKQFGYGGANDKINAYNDQYNRDYAASPAANSWAGTFGNIAGGAATAALGTPAIGGLLLRGALGGAIYGAQQNSASANPLAQDMAVNAGIGAAGGLAGKLASKYALPYLAQKFPGIAKTFDGAPKAASAATPAGRIEPTLEAQPARTVPQEVIPPSGPAAHANNEIADVRARKAAFDALGLTGKSGPSEGMLYRQPGAYTEEANLAKSQAQTKAGGAMLQKQQAIDQALRTHLENLRGGASEAAPRQVGQQVEDVLQNKWEGMQKQVGELYNGVLDAKGENYAATPRNLMAVVKEHSANFDADPVTVSIRRRMVDMGLPDPLGKLPPDANTVQKTALSVADAHNLRKFITRLKPKDATTGFVKREAVGALDDDVIGSSGVDELKTARAAAAARFKEFERKSLGAIQQGRMEPEDVIHKLVIAGKVNDVRDLVRGLTRGNPKGGKEALEEVKGQVIDHLMGVAHGPEGTNRFSPDKFSKEVAKLHDKLELLLTPAEMKDLANIRLAGHSAFKEPAGSAVNNAHSGIFNVHHQGGLRAFVQEVPEKLERINKSIESPVGRAVFEGTGAGTALRTAQVLAKPFASVAEYMGAAKMLNPNPEAVIAAHARATAAAPLQKFLARLPMSQASAALYQQQQSGRPQ